MPTTHPSRAITRPARTAVLAAARMVTLLGTLAALPRILVAQGAPSRGPIVGAHVGASAPVGDYQHTLELGVAAAVIVEAWPARQLGVRADFAYARFPRQADEFADVLSGYLRYLSAVGSVVVALRDPERGVAPYVLAGGGAYHVKSADRVELGPPFGTDARSGTVTRPGIAGGVGVRFPLGRALGTVEARVEHVLAEGPDLTLVPVTVGIRF